MVEIELKLAVRHALAALCGTGPERVTMLDAAEAQLIELISRELPGSGREDILRVVCECVTEAHGEAG